MVPAPALTGLTSPTWLLDVLGEPGASDQAATLATRLVAAGFITFVEEEAGPRYSFGRQPDGNPSEPWCWDDLN